MAGLVPAIHVFAWVMAGRAGSSTSFPDSKPLNHPSARGASAQRCRSVRDHRFRRQIGQCAAAFSLARPGSGGSLWREAEDAVMTFPYTGEVG